MDFWSGDTLGRIYRIVPNKPRTRRPLKVNVGKSSGAELAALLESANGWHRQTAQRLIVERQDKAAVPKLRELAAKSANPLGRVHALWTLEGLSELTPADVLAALGDSHAGVREQALRMAEPFLGKSKPVGDAALALAKDPSVRVKFQLAFSLGGWQDARVLPTLAQLAAAHDDDPWFRTAVLSSTGDSPGRFFTLLAPKGMAPEMLAGLGALIAAQGKVNEIAQFIAGLRTQKNPEAGLTGLARGFRLVNARSVKAPGVEAALAGFLNSPSASIQQAAWDAARYFELTALLAKASRDTADVSAPLDRRVVAARALRGGTFASVSPVLRKVLESVPPASLQAAAVESLAEFDDAGVGPLLLSYWRTYTPDARTKAVAALLSRRDRVPFLLKAIEDGRIPPGSVDAAARARLLEAPDKQVADSARRLFESAGGDRMKVVAAYKDALNLTGDVAHGKLVFEENCAKCHMPRKQGGRVGPDLSGVNNKTKDELLLSILNPSYAIEPRFTNYVITTKDGRLYDGVIAGETPAVLTLRGGAGEADAAILRRDIGEIRASAISLMPDELEKSMTKQDVADVISYLRAGL
jgi:putative heme-binding domain-containing protein